MAFHITGGPVADQVLSGDPKRPSGVDQISEI
jgi:hypothetical protein